MDLPSPCLLSPRALIDDTSNETSAHPSDPSLSPASPNLHASPSLPQPLPPKVKESDYSHVLALMKRRWGLDPTELKYYMYECRCGRHYDHWEDAFDHLSQKHLKRDTIDAACIELVVAKPAIQESRLIALQVAIVDTIRASDQLETKIIRSLDYRKAFEKEIYSPDSISVFADKDELGEWAHQTTPDFQT
ncbi:hypothetical protein SeMB42_g05100 [Synchytrium endobioticum]|uniref:Uncharacterized protein n=1 Tax=Synchytrium endobioticum TaxID=286115 RepID=A0A507CTL3_9FUNG|nr:hypothetical protein SeMB42_g05100 [Synchytrium endobioticum]